MTMKIKTLIIVGLVGMTMLAAASQQASAADFYFCTGGDGTWADPDAWYEESSCTTQRNAVPGANDAAFITVDCDIDDGNAVCSHIDVFNSVTLDILVGGKLKITGNTATTSTLNTSGIILLSTSTSDLSITDHDHTFTGTGGSIKGEDPAAEIIIADTLTMFNEAIVQGILTINTPVVTTESSTFDNRGTVEANDATGNGTLLVNTVVIADTSAGDWKVTLAGAVLQFDQEGGTQPALAGDFTVSAGTFDVEPPGLETSGALSFTAGTFDASDLGAGEEAKFTGSP